MWRKRPQPTQQVLHKLGRFSSATVLSLMHWTRGRSSASSSALMKASKSSRRRHRRLIRRSSNRIPSTPISAFAEPPRPIAWRTSPFLLVLDLNGTLVCRRKNKEGRAIPGKSATPRPYIQSFLQYCLGPLYTISSPKELNTAWPEDERVSIATHAQPTGAFYWTRHTGTHVWCAPRTPIQVMIWSSATRENVCKMVETVMTSSMQRALLQRVWARETLVTPRDFGRKVSTTKDLSIVWDELNEWDKYLRTRPSPDASMRWSSRASAEGRLFEIRHWARQTISRKEEVPRFSSIADELQAEAEIRRTQPELLHRAPLETHPYGPHNTILVDDSVDKAKCQPDNHICIPDYGEKQAALYKEYRKATNESEQDVNALDDYLLQLVGVLDTMADQSDVSTWIRNGGVRTFSSEQTPEDRALWVERGKKALSRYKIPLIV